MKTTKRPTKKATARTIDPNSALARFWAGSATQSVLDDYRAGRVTVIKTKS